LVYSKVGYSHDESQWKKLEGAGEVEPGIQSNLFYTAFICSDP
jgi:hypothetical protein